MISFFAQDKWQDRILIIETDELNFIENQQDLDYLVSRIKEALRLAPYQQSLPPGYLRSKMRINPEMLIKIAKDHVARRERKEKDLIAVI